MKIFGATFGPCEGGFMKRPGLLRDRRSESAPKSFVALLVLLIATPAIGTLKSKQPVGEIVNPSIEILDENKRPDHWILEPAPRGAAAPGGQSTSEVAHAGVRSLLLSTSTAWTNKTLVKPYATYQLTGWIKTQDLPGSGNVGATFLARGVRTTSPAPKIGGSSDWTRVDLTFETGDQDSLIVAAALVGLEGRRTGDPAAIQGKAFFDDLKLELVSARELKPEITIDVSKMRAPMPDLIYGQFIEHLGRCIYGGIWAEMLEDRKFYSAVGETRRDRINVASPWKNVGEAGAVTMVKENVFVGEHAPQVNLSGDVPGGIAQSGLGLVAGKTYNGYVVLAGDASSAPIEVSLVWGAGETDRQTIRIDRLTKDYRKQPIRFKAGASTQDGRLEIIGKGRGKFLIGPPSLMPEDNIGGMRQDTLALLRQLDAPIYRWPGGNFVSGYNWKDGIGDRDKRPPRKNPAWTGIEHNDFGMHEYFEFIRELKTQPFIALNAGLGSVDSAVEEVQYVNGGLDTPMGQLRAQNGRPKPFGCTYWAVGNEMSGSWQLGNVPLDEFVRRHNTFSQALLNVDKSIKLVASGEAVRPSSDWDRKLLTNSTAYINLISKHFYQQDYHGGGLMTHVRQIGASIRAIAEAHRDYVKTIPQMQGRDIRVSLDEWNYWYGPHVFGELGTRYFLRDALGIAAGINEYSRDTDVIALACYAQTVNVIGAIKTSKTAATLDSTGEALVMYRCHFGVIPVEVTGPPEPLDIAAAWMKDRKTLTISAVNPTYESQRLKLKFVGGQPGTQAKTYILTGPDDIAFNDPGKEPAVRFTEQAVTGFVDALEVKPVSATIFQLHMK
jgi:alpha-L-arabinofuranosidase